MSLITTTFHRLRSRGRAALMPYLTMGYPDLDSALDLVPAVVEAGADLIELGVPFSDPLADGATIQAASQRALDRGMTLSRCLEQVALLRARGIAIPLVLMGYYNPILQAGLAPFARDAAAAGLDGLIIPDLPPEESGPLRSAMEAAAIDLVFLLAPTSGAERLRLVVERTRGFLYLVSLVGVTGARDELSPGLASWIATVRSTTRLPLAVGFGISTPSQAARVADLADGVIVGSALVQAMTEGHDPIAAAAAFVASLRAGMAGP